MIEAAEVIGLGELLWDCFPDRRLPGGAPANVAFHAQQLGLRAAVATRVGQDELGDELCNFLLSQGLTTELVQRDPARPTGTVTIFPESETGVNYTILNDCAWDYLKSDNQLLDAVRFAKAVCFGTLAQRRPTTRATIQRCLRMATTGCSIVYDVNLRQPHVARDWIAQSLDQCTVVKLNNEEVKILANLFDLSTDEIRFAKGLLDRYHKLELVCVTRGGQGCLAVTCDETIEQPGIVITVVDTVGAGDAFTAAIIFGRLQNWTLLQTLDLANHFGALVASRSGAMPPLKAEVEELKSAIGWSFRDTPPVGHS